MTGTLLSARDRAVAKVKLLPHGNHILLASVRVCVRHLKL